MALLREFCAENMERVPAAVAAGAGRIELCDNLTVGGTSPSYGVVRAAVAFAAKHDVAVMAMARPRGGNFVYTPEEEQMMLDDVVCARRLGVTGVVFGCLVADSETGEPVIDRAMTKKLVDAAHGELDGVAPVWVTFHMAFDELDEQRQLAAIDTLAALGFSRILTHGGAAGTPIEEHLDRLRALIEHAAGRIIILPGGGISYANAETVAEALGVDEVHGTKIVKLA